MKRNIFNPLSRLAVTVYLAFAMGWVPSAFAASLDRYSHLPSLEEVRISPDGKRLAVVRQATAGRVVEVVDLASKKVIAALNVAELKQRDLQWGDNDHLLVIYSITGYAHGFYTQRHEWEEVISYNVNTKTQKMLLIPEIASDAPFINTTDLNPMVRDINGNKSLLFSAISFLNYQSVLTLFKVDLDGKVVNIVAQGNESTEKWWVLRDGKTLIREDYDQKLGVWSLWSKLPGMDFRQLYYLKVPIDKPSVLGVDEVERTLLIKMTDPKNNNDYDSIFRLSITEPTKPLILLKKSYDYLVHDPSTHSIIGGAIGGMTENLQFFSPHDQAQWQVIVKAYGEEKIQLESWSADRRIIIVQLDGPQSGAAFGMINLNTGKADWIGDRYDGLGPDDLGVVRQIAYKAADGLEIPALLTLPVGVKADPPPKNLPLIVLPHGGPAAHDKEEFDYFAQSLASQGYAVLQPQFRGSTGFGVDLWQAGFGQWGKKMQTDLSDGVRYLAKLGLIDPKRVAIMGGSYGGYAALAGAAFDGPVYRCAVSIAGISDPQRMVKWEAEQMGGADTSTVRYWDRFMGATKPSDPSFSEIAPIKHIDAIHIPILLIHGKDDTVVDFSQSQKMYEALKATGKPVELVTLKAEDCPPSFRMAA